MISCQIHISRFLLILSILICSGVAQASCINETDSFMIHCKELAKIRTKLFNFLHHQHCKEKKNSRELNEIEHAIRHYILSIPFHTLADSIYTISKQYQVSKADDVLLSIILANITSKDKMLILLSNMEHIPTKIVYTPTSVYLYHLGINQSELEAILDKPDLPPSTVSSIAIFIYEFKHGVFLISQPVSGKIPIHEASRLIFSK